MSEADTAQYVHDSVLTISTIFELDVVVVIYLRNDFAFCGPNRQQSDFSLTQSWLRAIAITLPSPLDVPPVVALVVVPAASASGSVPPPTVPVAAPTEPAPADAVCTAAVRCLLLAQLPASTGSHLDPPALPNALPVTGPKMSPDLSSPYPTTSHLQPSASL